jgi:hypothetical protein
MKKLALIAACLLFSTTLMCQSKLDHPITMLNTNGVTTTTISQLMLKNIENLNIGYSIGYATQKLTDKIESITVLKDNALDTMKGIESEYSELMSIKNNSIMFKLLVEQPQNETIKNFAVIVTEAGKSGLMIINGNFIIDDFGDFMAMIK